MAPLRGLFVTLVAGLALTGGFLHRASIRFHDPFPPLAASLSSPGARLEDFVGIMLGLRHLAADVAWIQTLQYYGTAEAGQSESAFENGLGIYPDFLSYCQRVTRIDPHFVGVYLYGSAVLAWNLNRLDEAVGLLKDGIAQNPSAWRLGQYLAGIAYERNHDIANLTRFLETMAQDPESPTLLKSLLANLYKKRGDYYKALQLWLSIYDHGDPSYASRAEDQIKVLQGLLHIPSLTK